MTDKFYELIDDLSGLPSLGGSTEDQGFESRDAETNALLGRLPDGSSRTGMSVKAAFANAPMVQSAYGLYDSLQQRRDDQYDPHFDSIRFMDDNSMGYDQDVYEMLSHAKNSDHMKQIQERVKTQKHNAALASTTLAGNVAQFGASQLSVENVLFTLGTLGTGYYGVVAKAAKDGLLANNIRRAAMARNALQTSAAGGLSAYAGATVDAEHNVAVSEEDATWALLFGSVFGAAYGGSAGNVWEKMAQPSNPQDITMFYSFGGNLADDAKHLWAKATRDGYRKFSDAHAQRAALIEEFRNAAGDDAVKQLKTSVAKPLGMDELLDMDDPQAFAKSWWADEQMDERIAMARSSAEDIIDTVLPSDFSQFANSKSDIAKAMVYNVLESGTATVPMTSTASIRMDRYQRGFAYALTPAVRRAKKAYWLDKTNGQGMWNRARGLYDNNRAFNEELTLYQNARYNGLRLPDVHPAVKQAAEEIQKGTDMVFGKALQSGLSGFENIKRKAGYLPIQHHKESYRHYVSRYGKDATVDLVAKSYMSAMPKLEKKKARVFARATVHRFSEGDIDFRAGTLMPDESWDILESHLKAEGFKMDDMDSLKKQFGDLIQDNQENKGRVRFGKERIPMDLSVTNGEMRMLDLVNTDVEGVLGNYSMSMAGNIAMAEAGIKNRGQWRKLRNAILKEDPDLETALDNLERTFTTGRIGGGIENKYVALASKLPVLMYLNNLGLTQLTESGTAIATYGIHNFMSTGTKAMRGMYKGESGMDGLAQEVVDMFGWVGKDHISMAPHLNLELQKRSLTGVKAVDYAEGLINHGMSIQGYTSGFNFARSAQQHIALNGLAQKITKYIDTGKGLDNQLVKLGIGDELFDSIKANIKKHGSDGTLYGNKEYKHYGLSKWDNATRDKFIDVIVRNMDGIVQKANAGESSAWMSQDVGAMLTQLKKFAIESVRKQAIRKYNVGDGLLITSAATNLAVAGLILSAGNYVKGSDTEVQMSDVLRNGINYNADFGSLASLWDIGVSLSGADEGFYANPYSIFSDGVFGIPALSAANDLVRLPANWADVVTGNPDNDSVRGTLTTPIIGNHIMFSRMQRSWYDNEETDKEN